MWAARKTSPLGVAAPGVPFPLSCRHHDGRLPHARTVLFACLHSTSTYRLFGPFVQLWEVLCGFVLTVWTYCRPSIFWLRRLLHMGLLLVRGYVRRLLYCRFGLLLLQFSPYDVTGTSFPRDLLLALLEVFKGP